MNRQGNNSPILVMRFFDGIVRSEAKRTISGDMMEWYGEIALERGRAAAGFWLWKQILYSLPVFLKNTLKCGGSMLGNYLKVALRNMWKRKAYAFINIAGLSIGMACFILILLYVQYEYSYEKHNPNANRVYHVYVEHTSLDSQSRFIRSTPVPMVQTLAREIPDIEEATRMYNLPKLLISYEDRKFSETNLTSADPAVFDLFGFQIVNGDKKSALADVNTVVLTEEMAQKYFGDEDPIGRTLTADASIPLMVTAVIRNHPPNTDYQPDMIISMKTIELLLGDHYTQNWLSQVLQSYILVPETHSVQDLEDKLESSFKTYRAKENDDRVLRLELLSRIHLYSVFGNQEYRTLLLFIGVGVLILLIACINFMNLSTARSASRAREVGMRKTIGALRGQIVHQFFGECFLYAGLCAILGLVLACLAVPVLSDITEQSLKLGQIWSPAILLSLLAAFLFVGLFSGSYPALFLSSFRPMSMLKGNFATGKNGALFRKILVVFQFSISIALIVSTLVFNRQIRYMNQKPLGFDQDQIVVLRSQGEESIVPFRQHLTENPRIISATGSYMLPHSIGMYNEVTWEGAENNETIGIIHNTVDYDYIKTYEIELLAGRNFSRDFPSDTRSGTDINNAGSILLNETAVKRFGWDDPIGKKVIQTFGELRIVYTVIGVIRDFHFSSLRNAIRPLKIFLNDGAANYISIKIQAQDVQNTLKFIEESWKQYYPNYPFEYYFYDSLFEHRYLSEEKLQTLFSYFCMLAIFIGCLGLFGLASFAAEQRTKEIGVRKILGASVRGVVLLLSKEFLKWVILANAIAWPAAYFAMKKWLEGYAYHTTLSLWLFLLAGLLALILALATVSFRAFRAALANPVDSLRYE